MDADGDEEMADSTPVFGMTRCTRRQCVTCMSRLCMDNFVENKVTLQQFPISFNGTCRTSNCIYVIKCTHPNCNYQYVGHTIKGGIQGKFFWSSRFELWAPQVPLIVRETFGEILGPRRPTVSEPRPAQKLGVK